MLKEYEKVERLIDDGRGVKDVRMKNGKDNL